MDRPDLLLDAPPRKPWAAFQRTGDVGLTVGAGPFARVELAIRSLLQGRSARATRAMMVVAPCLRLDAGPQTGVALVPAERCEMGQGETAKVRRSFARRQLVIVVERLGPRLERAARLARPRWPVLTTPLAERSTGLAVLVSSVILFLPLPLSNIPPGIALAIWAWVSWSATAGSCSPVSARVASPSILDGDDRARHARLHGPAGRLVPSPRPQATAGRGRARRRSRRAKL